MFDHVSDPKVAIFSKSGPCLIWVSLPQKLMPLIYSVYVIEKKGCFSGTICYVEDIREAVLSSVWEALSQEA